jgi:hypothetical protein
VAESDENSQTATAWLLPRLAALIIDALLVFALVELATATAYKLTDGRVQGTLGFAFSSCEPVSQLPTLTPPPPDGLTYALTCTRSLFGFDMASSLNVGRVARAGDGSLASTGYTYLLDPAGEQVDDAFTVQSLHAVLVLIAYLAVMDWLSGASFGKRLLRLRTVDPRHPERRGIPLATAFLRHAAMQAGPLVLLACAFVYGLLRPELQPGQQSGLEANLFWPLIGGWLLWNAMRLMNKSEPLYDLAAGTTVVRTL